MGIFDALTTAVSGLQAQSFALQNISGNIANSQTVGYKETDTAFDALVSQAALGEQTSGGVYATSVASNGVQGTIQNETVPTDMAINGQGYFVVTQSTGNSGTTPQFSGVNDYTRRGDFQMDSNGYLVNGAGYYLMGIPVDPATGAPTASSPQVLQFNNDFLPAQATTSINYAANLPSAPPTGVLDPANFSATSNPLDAASGGTGTVIGQDTTTFTNASLDGGSITAYDSLGNPVNVQLRWAETASLRWEQFVATVLSNEHEPDREPGRVAERRHDLYVQFKRPIDFAHCEQPKFDRSGRERRHGRQCDAELWRQPDAVRIHDRQRAGHQLDPERFRCRFDAVAFGRSGPDRRLILERPNCRSGERHAGDVQRPGFAAAAQRRGFRSHA